MSENIESENSKAQYFANVHRIQKSFGTSVEVADGSPGGNSLIWSKAKVLSELNVGEDALVCWLRHGTVAGRRWIRQSKTAQRPQDLEEGPTEAWQQTD